MKYLDVSLIKKVEASAIRAAERNKTAESDIADYWDKLSKVDPEDIWQKLSDYPSTRWNGAVPVSEPAGISQDTSAGTKGIMAIDGSQINPDPDMPCRWAYVHAVAVGSQEQNYFRSDYIDFDELLAGEVSRKDLGWLVGTNLGSLEVFVQYLRTSLELDVCLETSVKFPTHIIIWDNPLLPLGAGSNRELLHAEYDRRIAKMTGRELAGYISGPRSHLLADLIALSESNNPNQALKARLPIDDSMLVRQGIPVGHRSAIFRYGNPFGKQKYTAIYFFFIRITRNEIARIEVPEWIGKDIDRVAEIHATILKDTTGLGYPLSLLSAHHAAVIPLNLGQEINLRAWSTYTAHGGRYYPSAKVLAKRG